MTEPSVKEIVSMIEAGLPATNRAGRRLCASWRKRGEAMKRQRTNWAERTLQMLEISRAAYKRGYADALREAGVVSDGEGVGCGS